MKWDYWFGPDEEDRRIKYADEFNIEYQQNGDGVTERIAAVETAFFAETGIALPPGYSSGWRPGKVNESTSNAGKKSTHLQALSGDKRDDVDGAFAWWCQRNTWVLERHELWMEHPIATVVRSWVTAKKQKRAPTPWCHLQHVPPGSGLRVYFPDTKSVKEWTDFEKSGGYAGMSHEAWIKLGEPDAETTT